MPWDFYFFKLTQPLTVFYSALLYTEKEKRGKPDRTSGFWPCVRARLSGLIATHNGALRAPRLSQLRCSHKNKKSTIYTNKMRPFWPELSCQGRIFFHWAKLHPTELHCILLNYVAPFWAPLPPPELRCTREIFCLAKNPPKYTTVYIVQQSNCRWHCESIHVSLVWIKQWKVSSYLSLFNPSLSKPSFSSPWSVWLLKLKE